jgi:hypothetical protein
LPARLIACIIIPCIIIQGCVIDIDGGATRSL